MQAYLIKNASPFLFKNEAKKETIILINNNDCYIFWDISSKFNDLIVDYFKIEEMENKKQIIFQKSMWNPEKVKWGLKDQEAIDKWITQLNQFQKININQYLTHENEVIREIVKEILNYEGCRVESPN